MLFKSKKHLRLEHNSKKIKDDSAIVKLDISNFHKAVIPRIKSTETLKNRSSIHFLIKTVRSPENSFDAKIVWSWRLQIVVSGVW